MIKHRNRNISSTTHIDIFCLLLILLFFKAAFGPASIRMHSIIHATDAAVTSLFVDTTTASTTTKHQHNPAQMMCKWLSFSHADTTIGSDVVHRILHYNDYIDVSVTGSSSSNGAVTVTETEPIDMLLTPVDNAQMVELGK